MANGIPPFLPATPPPMCELDDYEYEDDDEFGDFSNVSDNCYHDNIVTKASGDNELNHTKRVLDSATNNQTDSKENIALANGIEDIPCGDFAHPINISSINGSSEELSEENQPKLEICDSGLSENCTRINLETVVEKTVATDPIKLNNDSVETLVTNSGDLDFNLHLNENDHMVEDSICDSYNEKSMIEKKVTIDSENNETENISNFADYLITNSIENIESTITKNANIEKSAESDEDFTSFFHSENPKDNDNPQIADLSFKLNSEQINNTSLQKEMSQDSDDSNIPDIDFNCFITCSNDHPKDDDFGDFIKPAELDVFDKTYDENFTSTYSHDELSNFEFNESFRTQDSSMTLVTNDFFQAEQKPDDMDDDFSDFVSTACPSVIPHTVISETNTANLTTVTEDDFEPFSDFCSGTDNIQLSATQSDLCDEIKIHATTELEKMKNLDTEYWMEIFQKPAEDQIEMNVNTFEGKLKGSSVWCTIKNIESSPALSYNWNDSETQKTLLSALYVDSRNILFGPRWNSEVPRFASNLGFSPLVPQKATESKDIPIENSPQPVVQDSQLFETNTTTSQAPSSVPDAHFDWNNSGLTNPLDSYTHSSLLDLDLLASFDIHSPYYKKSRKTDRRKDTTVHQSNYENSLFAKTPHCEELSEEAKEVLNNLPNLYVMEKQYIVFPVS